MNSFLSERARQFGNVEARAADPHVPTPLKLRRVLQRAEQLVKRVNPNFLGHGNDILQQRFLKRLPHYATVIAEL